MQTRASGGNLDVVVVAIRGAKTKESAFFGERLVIYKLSGALDNLIR